MLAVTSFQKSSRQQSVSSWTLQALENTPTISGRYMLANAQEYACEARCLTVDGAEIIAAKSGEIGEWIILYLDNLGILIARVEQQTLDGFAVSLHITSERRERIRARIEWHAGAAAEPVEQRASARVVPRDTEIQIHLASGRSLPGTIIDLSLSGAAVRSPAATKVAVGDGVRLGKTVGTVVRRFDGGFAVRFQTPFSSQKFVPDIKL